MAPLVEFHHQRGRRHRARRRLCFYRNRCERVAASAGRNGTLVPLFKVVTVQIACGKGIGAFECLLLPASGRLDARRRVEIRVKIAF